MPLQEIGYAERCFRDVQPCGDGMISQTLNSQVRLILADGMGHGSAAHCAVNLLREKFSWISERSQPALDIAHCIREMHEWLKGHGDNYQAAVAMVEIDNDLGILSALSIGNIMIKIVSGRGVCTLPCTNGMVGGEFPARTRLTVESLPRRGLLVIHSDGISSRALSPFLEHLRMNDRFRPGEAQSIASKIITQFAKSSDDASCIVVSLTQKEDPSQCRRLS